MRYLFKGECRAASPEFLVLCPRCAAGSRPVSLGDRLCFVRYILALAGSITQRSRVSLSGGTGTFRSMGLQTAAWNWILLGWPGPSSLMAYVPGAVSSSGDLRFQGTEWDCPLPTGVEGWQPLLFLTRIRKSQGILC